MFVFLGLTYRLSDGFIHCFNEIGCGTVRTDVLQTNDIFISSDGRLGMVSARLSLNEKRAATLADTSL